MMTKKTCLICNKEVMKLQMHLLNKHDMELEDYAVKYIYNGIVPKCECGCGQEMSFAPRVDGYYYKKKPGHHEHRKLTDEEKARVKQRTEEAVMKKYGVNTTFKLDSFKQKRKERSLKLYGTEYEMSSPKYQKKLKRGMRKKYGKIDNVFQSEEIKAKIKKTNLERYGVENPNQCKDIQEKIANTNLERYGNVCPMQNGIIQEEIKQKNLEKYGVEYILSLKEKRFDATEMTVESREKAKQTVRDKYGVENVGQSEEIKEKIKKAFNDSIGYDSNFSNPEFRKLYNGKNSKIELEVCEKLGAEHKFIYENKEFDMIVGDDIIELDGDFWHPKRLENLTISQVNSVVNDVQKTNLILSQDKYKLYKIRQSDLPSEITLENIKKNSYTPNYTISYSQKIMTREYLQNYIEKYGVDKLLSYVPLLLKFVRTFDDMFAFDDVYKNDDLLSGVISKVILIHDFSIESMIKLMKEQNVVNPS